MSRGIRDAMTDAALMVLTNELARKTMPTLGRARTDEETFRCHTKMSPEEK